MDEQLRSEYAEIGRERDAAGRIHDRQRFWFWVKIGAAMWAWTIVGAAIMANAFHIQASVGPFFFPDRMDEAKLWLQGGIFVGGGGAFATLIWGWRTAMKRGYLD